MSAQFENEVSDRVRGYGRNAALRKAAQDFMDESINAKYSYNFSWLGRPIIQYPQDIIGFQELVYRIKPDLIIETGIAHGGSLILSASLMALLDLEDAASLGNTRDHARKVVGIDIDIRPHNRDAIENHFLSERISLLQGSSLSNDIVDQVKIIASGYENVLVCLDSNHTHEHVLRELELYSPFVSPGSYCIVYDSVVENLQRADFSDRDWGIGDNPMTALLEFTRQNPNFEIDAFIDQKLQISVAPQGFLRRRT